MGGIAFDPLDVSGNTVFAGPGSTSSLSNAAALPIGIMKTTDDGETWSVFPLEPGGSEPQVRMVVPTTYDAIGRPGGPRRWCSWERWATASTAASTRAKRTRRSQAPAWVCPAAR